MEDSKLRQPQRDETRFTRQVELTMPDDVLVLILDDDIVTGHHSRYESVLMLALWVSLSRSRSGKVCAEFKKKKRKKQQERKRTSMSRVVSRYIYSRKKPSTCSFHRAIFRGVFFFHVHKEGRILVVFTRPSASRSLSALAPRSYQPFCTRSLRNDACREIHGVTVSGSAKIAYCFTGQNVALFLSSILESNLFRFDTRYKLFAGFCTLNHSIYMLLYVAELDFFSRRHAFRVNALRVLHD